MFTTLSNMTIQNQISFCFTVRINISVLIPILINIVFHMSTIRHVHVESFGDLVEAHKKPSGCKVIKEVMMNLIKMLILLHHMISQKI